MLELKGVVKVAPHVGAWIETYLDIAPHISYRVAPHVGAWIETYCYKFKDMKKLSHPMWVRGLKQIQIQRDSDSEMSHPMWVRGLKLLIRTLGALPIRRTPCGCVD